MYSKKIPTNPNIFFMYYKIEIRVKFSWFLTGFINSDCDSSGSRLNLFDTGSKKISFFMCSQFPVGFKNDIPLFRRNFSGTR